MFEGKPWARERPTINVTLHWAQGFLGIMLRSCVYKQQDTAVHWGVR